MKNWVAVVPVKLKPQLRDTHGKAADAVSPVLGFSADLPDPGNDIKVSEDDIFKNNTRWDIRDLTFEDDREPSALQSMQKPCKEYG